MELNADERSGAAAASDVCMRYLNAQLVVGASLRAAPTLSRISSSLPATGHFAIIISRFRVIIASASIVR